MSLSVFATIVSVCNGIVTFFKSIFGSKKTESAASTGPSVAEANVASKQSAAIARAMDVSTQEAIHESQSATATDVAAVRDAPSLQDGADVVQAAVARANSIGRANNPVRRK